MSGSMKDQIPSELRFGVLWMGEIQGVYECIEDAEEEATDCVRFDNKLGSASIIDLEIRPLNQPMCEWEKSFGEPGSWKVFRAGPHYKDEMEEDFSMTPKYCPNCGRRLEEP